MVTSLLHSLASYPVVYDWIQRFAGHSVVDAHVRQAAAATLTQDHLMVLDVGGGTGKGEKLWPDSTYICLDMDPMKLSPFKNKTNDHFMTSGLLADATTIPLRNNSFDVVVCCLVSHHIPDPRLTYLLSECVRVVKPNGVFLFVDAVWDAARPVGRLLWAYDRGGYPHQAKRLDGVLGQCGTVLLREEFTTLHHFVLYLLKKDSESQIAGLPKDRDVIHS